MCNAQMGGENCAEESANRFQEPFAKEAGHCPNPSSDPSALLTVGQPHAFQEFGSALGGGKHVSFAEEASLKSPSQCFLGFGYAFSCKEKTACSPPRRTA